MLENILPNLITLIAALGAVWLTQRHQAKQSERNRQMALRRDIYLDVIKGMSQATQYLGNLADSKSFINDPTSPLMSNPGWQYQVDIVSAFSTIEAVARANTYFVRVLARALPLRVDLASVKQSIDSIVNERSQLGDYLRRLEEPRAHARASNAVAGIASLSNALDDARRQSEELRQHEYDLRQQQRELFKGLLRVVIDGVADYRLLIAQAILEIRKEIEFPLDDSEYLMMTKDTNDAVLNTLQQFLDELERGSLQDGSHDPELIRPSG